MGLIDMKRLLRYAWAAPCTLVGLCAALLTLPFHPRFRVVEGIIEVTLGLVRKQRFSAITLGHVVLAVTDAELDRLRTHEHEHVRQYERWGIVFFVAYPLSSLWQAVNGRRPYEDNWFEVRAREAARNEQQQKVA